MSSPQGMGAQPGTVGCIQENLERADVDGVDGNALRAPAELGRVQLLVDGVARCRGLHAQEVEQTLHVRAGVDGERDVLDPALEGRQRAGRPLLGDRLRRVRARARQAQEEGRILSQIKLMRWSTKVRRQQTHRWGKPTLSPVQ
jgi:hypothetical protein